jgi:hypothetical protein
LELPVTIGEVGEQEEREPVRCALVERAQDAGLVGVAGMTLEHLVGFVATVATEVAVQQVHHRPQVPTFLDVHLEQVAHVVQAGRGEAQAALLLDRRRLGVALHDDQAAQVGAVLAGHLLPHVGTFVIAEGDPAIRLGVGKEHAPAILGHRHVTEVRPTLLADRDRGAQVDRVLLERDRALGAPPFDELRLP